MTQSHIANHAKKPRARGSVIPIAIVATQRRPQPGLERADQRSSGESISMTSSVLRLESVTVSLPRGQLLPNAGLA